MRHQLEHNLTCPSQFGSIIKSVFFDHSAKNCHSERSEESAVELNKKQIPRPEPAPSEVEGASE